MEGSNTIDDPRLASYARVGGQENCFHCDTCGLCLPVGKKESHLCRQGASRTNCPVCMEVS